MEGRYMKVYLDPSLTAKDVMRLYGLSQPSAYRAVKKGYFHKGISSRGGRVHTRTIQGFKLDNATVELVARHTANYLAGSSRKILAHGKALSDLQDEIAQAARIELWVSGADTEALAYVAAKRAGLNAIRKWFIKHSMPLEQWALENEPEPVDSEDNE